MVRKLMTMVAAAALAVGPTAAQAASPLSLAGADVRAGAEMGDANALRGSNAPVFIGLILIVLFAAIVSSDGRDEPSNSP